MNYFTKRMVSAIALCVASSHWAHADKRDPTLVTGGPTPTYRSAFEGYKSWQDVKPGDWRELNDAVRQGGMPGMGHMHDLTTPASDAGHMSHPSAPSASAASAATPSPMA